MRLIFISTDISPDNSSMHFTLTASDPVPSTAFANVTISYINADDNLIKETKQLQDVIISGDTIEGRIDVKEIHDSLLEDYQFTSSISNVSIEMEEEVLAEAPIDQPLAEIEVFTHRPIVSKVNRIWANQPGERYRNSISTSTAYPDYNNAVQIKITIPQKFGFPGVYKPQLITEVDLNNLLAGLPKDLMENNGKVYAVENEFGFKQIGVLFANEHRAYVIFYRYTDVYTDPIVNGSNYLDQHLLTRIKGGSISKTRTESISALTDAIEIESTYFQDKINTMLETYTMDEMLFDTRAIIDYEPNTHLKIDEIGSSTSQYA